MDNVQATIVDPASRSSATGRHEASRPAVTGTGRGLELAAKKSRLTRDVQRLGNVRRIIIVDDNVRDGQHISAILNLLLGRAIHLTVFKSIANALVELRDHQPDLLFLDDLLPPLDRAESSVRSLRRNGLVAPIIVMSGMLTIERRKELAALGILGVIHKDDIDSVSIAEILVRLLPEG